jgi:hypothetical protein
VQRPGEQFSLPGDPNIPEAIIGERKGRTQAMPMQAQAKQSPGATTPGKIVLKGGKNAD